MWGCGDVGMWRCGDVEMWRCGNVEMWGCGDVGITCPSVVEPVRNPEEGLCKCVDGLMH
jgi:hypothetical protein